MNGKKLSLAELMGSTGASHAQSGSLRLSHLHEILGDAMPELPHNAIGRHRLMRALHQRFGPNFRSLPGVMGLMHEFDGKIDFQRRLEQLKTIKYEPKKESK